MTPLREAAQQAVEYMKSVGKMDMHPEEWAIVGRLEAALAEPVLQTCNCRWNGEVQVQQCTLHEAHVDAIHEWAERAKTAEKKLAALAEPDFDSPERPAEPVQDPDSPERRCGGPGCDMRCCQPVAWLTPGQDLHLNNGEGFRFSDWTPLYTAPPQRKPLAEWQINDLMADIDPEDRDSWSFRQGVYAAEKHHGVRK